jgi:integrase/recombinase XerD
LDSIGSESLKDIRDKAIFSVLLYSWCRVSALISLTVTDYNERGGTRWLRFQEKRGKKHEVPVHSKAKEAVDLWLERSHLASNPSAPLFPSFGKNRETIEPRHLDRRSVLKLVEKRARTSGILKRVCCHSFRATGVTEYMNSGGTIEIAQRIAGHTSPATTRIYDRSGGPVDPGRDRESSDREGTTELNSAPRASDQDKWGASRDSSEHGYKKLSGWATYARTTCTSATITRTIDRGPLG